MANIVMGLSLVFVLFFLGAVRGQDEARCNDPTGVLYRGTLSQTTYGRTCQKWTSQSPHKHTTTPEKYPNSGLGDHNYCRNPDQMDSAWCYTTNPNESWEYCAIGIFNEGYKPCDELDARLVDTSNNGYSGRVEVLVDGTWYGICFDNWRNLANVVCPMLFPGRVSGGAQTPSDAPTDYPSFKFIPCEGYEDRLNECLNKQGWTTDKVMKCDQLGRTRISCVEPSSKKDMDLKDDLKIRTAELLLQLLKDKK